MKRSCIAASPLMVLFAAAFFLAAVPFPRTAHGLQVVPLESEVTPSWFRLWQEARELRGQDDGRAAEIYEKLLREKPGLKEARWEYCQLLVNRHEKAITVCEPLTEADPNNRDYLLMVGRLALSAREYKRAISYLQKYTDSAPGDNEATRLLVKALEHLGEVKKSLPYLQSLAQAHPDDLDLSWRLFTAARQAGEKEKAVAEAISLSQAERLSTARLLELARYLEKSGDEAAAAQAQERYLKINPGYQPFHKALAATYLTQKQPAKAWPHLTTLAETGQATPEELVELARIHRYRQDAGKALHYYETARTLRPDDTALAAETMALRRVFAKSLIADVQRDRAPEMWNELDRMEIDRLALYTVLAEEMEKSGKRKGLLELLGILKEKAPEPDRYTLRIARLLAAGGDDEGAFEMMRQVRQADLRDAGYFRERAAIATRLGLVADALADYHQAIALKPQETASHEEAIALAAEAGLTQELSALAPAAETPLAVWLAWLQGLADNGLFTRAAEEYGQLLASERIAVGEKQQLRRQRAKMYARMGRLAEAEQEYRLLLAETTDPANRQSLLLALTSLLLDAQATREAGQWLALAPAGTPLDDRFTLARWRLDLQKDRSGAALDQLREHIDALAAMKGQSHIRLASLRLLLAEGCAARGDLGGARTALAAISGAATTSGEFAALRLLAQEEARKNAIVTDNGQAGGGSAHGDFSRYRQYLAAARLAKRLGLLTVAAKMAETALHERPDSLAARAIEARLSMLRNSPEAARQYQKLQNEYPDEAFFRREYLTALLTAGKTTEFRERLAENKMTFPALEEKLLLARADWQEGRRDEAIRGYETLLSTLYPDEKNAAKRDQDSLWQIFSFSDPEELARLERATNPRQFWHADAAKAKSGAHDFARQRFEQTVRHEYMARYSLVSRQYKSAERQYRRSLQNESTVSDWRDLANIYERLGQYGKEAEIYSVLSAQGLDNPELRDAMVKNQLLRAPRLSLGWNERDQDGRDGMKNLRESTIDARVWLMPSLTSEVTIVAGNINYNAAKGEAGGVTGRRLAGNASIELNDSNILTGGVGFHTTDADNGAGLMLYDLALRHRFDQMLQGFIRVRQELIDDTLTSVTRGYSRQGYEGGLELDAPSGFALGAEFARNRLETDNNENRLSLWAGYSFFGEFSTLSLKYKHLIARQDKAGPLTIDPIIGGKSNSLHYWSPGNYWLQQASASYRYLLAGLGFPGQNDSYASLSLSTGYESGDSALVSGSFDISLELTRHFLLKGNLLFSKVADFEEKGGSFSLVYRW